MLKLRYSAPALMLLITLGAGFGLFAAKVLPTVPEAHAANVSIRLIGTTVGWNFSTSSNPTITVTQGDTVSITLTSTDTTHQFALDVDRDGPLFIAACSPGDICSTMFTPTTGTTVTIATASLSGTYTYFCTFHSGMVGSFVVNPSSTVGGTLLPVDKLALLAPYIGFASIIVAVVASAMVYAHRSENRKEK